MPGSEKIATYSPKEERLNILSHGFGLILAVLGSLLLIAKGMNQSGNVSLIAYLIYGLSMIFLYGASTLYHSSKDAEKRTKLRIVDHIGIYFLIAGTYTPFCLITLQDSKGFLLFISIWIMALIGTIFKLFYTGRFEKLSTVTYVLMGWSAIFAINPLIESLDKQGLYWLVAGGIGYTIGAIIYSVKKIKYNHAIFHFFVLIGSFCHYMAVYFYTGL